MDPAFEGVGQEPGLLIWRIENFEVVPCEQALTGKFYSGDSYIVLHTKLNWSGSLTHDVHFWLGADTSLDESGTAAIKSVELDDSLGGAPVQHREVMGHESKLFLSYFKKAPYKCLFYEKGGVASGFRHVDPEEYDNCLFQVKGKRNVRVKQVEMSVESMNKDDCFILDTVKDIYVYHGSGSRKMERLKAILTANDMKSNDHAGDATIHVLDEAASEEELVQFFSILGSGSVAEVPDASETEDAEHERSEENVVTLLKVSGDEGDVQVEEVGQKPLKQEMLNPGDCFILDTAGSGLFAWIGKDSSKEEKAQAMKKALSYLEQKGYPKWTKVSRVVQLAEPAAFKQYFSVWEEPEEQRGLGRIYTKEQVAASLPERDFNVASLHRQKRQLLAKSAGKAYGFMPDDGSGKVEIFRIENFELALMEEHTHGMFFGGDSYVLKYTYEKDGREHYVIYFWQGRESSQDEKAASAIQAVNLDNELGGKAVQVRVVQDQEPHHFVTIFKGRMVIFMGGHASGFKNVHDHDTYDADGTRMFRVRGTCADDVRAVQVPEVASSLNSGDVFVLETPGGTFVWQGNMASDEEKEMSANVAKIVSPDNEAQVLAEGEEPEEFWAAIGGAGDYQRGYTIPSAPLLLPRLFHCVVRPSGKLRVEEVDHYGQEDLIEDEVMVLDTGDEIFVWIGSGATDEERQKGITMAEEYVRTDPTDRSLDNTVVLKVKQGDEPAAFTALFPAWDPEHWQKNN